MSKQKEDVLLMIKHVRYKKVDGTLYVNSGRVAWRNQTSDSFRISAAFEDIRVQRISPDQKEKVQLQLLMHNGESFTFQFSDPGGRAKQLEMRNNIKEMLQSLLPKFKDKAQSELKEKLRLLETNPDTLALYKELVVTGILSSDEFWARPEFSNATAPASKTTTNTTASTPTSNSQRKPDSRTGQAGSNSTGTGTTPSTTTADASQTSGQISRSFRLPDKPQMVGVPSYLLSDIKPETDGATGIKYNLTHDTIDAIFRAYPTIRQRHRELVPDKLSEADFWIKFFQSHYFHRDRVHVPKEDVFAECAPLDERYLLNEIRRSRRSRISACLDLDNLSDHDLGQGYGVETELVLPTSSTSSSNQATGTKSTDTTQTSNLSANQLLLRRFNNHSILVLKSLGAGDLASGLASLPSHSNPTVTNPQSTETTQLSANPSSDASMPMKERIYTSELTEDAPQPQFSLELVSTNDYLEGPTTSRDRPSSSSSRPHSVSNQPARLIPNTPGQLESAVQQCQASIRAAYETQHRPRCILNPIDAQIALADVSPGGCLVGGKQNTNEHPSSSRTDSMSRTNDLSGRTSLDPTRCNSSSGGSVTGNMARSSGGSNSGNNPSGSSSSNRDTTRGDTQVDRGPIFLNADQLRELSLLYASSTELLRHFWACFPVTQPQLAEKLERIAASLTRFRTTKLSHFAASLEQSVGGKSDVGSNNSSGGGGGGTIQYRSRVTAHLECMLDAAEEKYAEWSARPKR